MTEDAQPPARRGLAQLSGRPAVKALVVVLATAAVYAASLGAPFVFDDASAVASNPDVADLGAWLASFGWRRNRSVADFTFALNGTIHGTGWVAGYHVVNALLHAACGLLVLRLARLLLASPFVAEAREAPPERGAPIGPFVAALVFVLHPVQTGAVTYVAQRFTVLAALLYVAATVLYLEWRRAVPVAGRRRHVLLAGAFLCAVLAMRTKEIAFTLPIVLVLAEFLFHAGPVRPRLLGLAPFVATMAIIPAALLVGASSFDVVGNDAIANPLRGNVPLGRGDYLLTQFRVVPTYLRLLLLPVDLTFDYDFPAVHSFGPAVAAWLLLLLAVFGAGIALIVASRRGDRRLRIAGFGVLWFFVALSVESSLIPIDDVIFEHRVYLPAVGFALVVAAGFDVARGRLGERPRRALVAAVAVWLLALAAGTVARNLVWSDPVAFWRDAVAKAPGKSRNHQNLGSVYVDRGWLGAALGEYDQAVQLAPNDALARFTLGNLYLQLGQTDSAIGEFKELLRIAPRAPATRTRLAGLYRAKGLLDDAEREAEAALAINPAYAPARRELQAIRRQRLLSGGAGR